MGVIFWFITNITKCCREKRRRCEDEEEEVENERKIHHIRLLSCVLCLINHLPLRCTRVLLFRGRRIFLAGVNLKVKSFVNRNITSSQGASQLSP